MTWSVGTVDRHRVLSVVAAAGFVAAIALAVIGLPAVDLHGPLHQWGIMDPFCGGTRAARFAMQGQWALAWTYNPLGIAAVAAAALGVVRLLSGLLSGRWVNVSVSWTPRLRRSVLMVLSVFLVVLEVRQQSLADMLRSSVNISSTLLGAP